MKLRLRCQLASSVFQRYWHFRNRSELPLPICPLKPLGTPAVEGKHWGQLSCTCVLSGSFSLISLYCQDSSNNLGKKKWTFDTLRPGQEARGRPLEYIRGSQSGQLQYPSNLLQQETKLCQKTESIDSPVWVPVFTTMEDGHPANDKGVWPFEVPK